MRSIDKRVLKLLAEEKSVLGTTSYLLEIDDYARIDKKELFKLGVALGGYFEFDEETSKLGISKELEEAIEIIQEHL